MPDDSGRKIDLSQFHEAFFQESLEGLAVMENGLLALSAGVAGKVDPEVIHDVFRAAHSIKGGSATFGFDEITNFTHLLETILDEMRQGEVVGGAAKTEPLLEAVDGLRELVNARLEERQADSELIERMTAKLTSGMAITEQSEAGDAKPKTSSIQDLLIKFRPSQSIFYTGNDPLLYLVQLSKEGELQCRVATNGLAALRELDTQNCYLAWEASLSKPHVTEQQAREIFEWIEDECELTIEDLHREKTPVVVADNAKPIPAAAVKENASLRVAAAKVDAVINLVGELVITQSMLSCIGDEFQMNDLLRLREGIAQLTRNTRELQETVLRMRMLPISNLFDRVPRLVHDLGRKLGKPVKLQITGEQTELDKTVLERMGDPLVHLVRNSMDHGLELPDKRREQGKPEEGMICLHAEHKGGNIVIEISDDGAGLNEERILARAKERGLVGTNETLTSPEIQALIFAPGFSTAVEVTDLSGRGVGMDVVRKNVEALSGRINLSSKPGKGAIITIRLPLTLAIMDGQLMRVRDERFVVPLVSIIESVKAEKTNIKTVADDVELFRWRNEYLRVVHLREIFNLGGEARSVEDGLLVIVESRDKRVALSIDDLLGQQQVVIKSLEANFQRVEGVAGATILGDGTVAMILDVAGIIEISRGAMAVAS